MGFQIVYKYREQLDGGNYTDETKEMVRTVGEAYEDVSYEKLAGSIIAQMARREIFVVDVEIYEFAKKKVNFRQSRGGLIIGNKKYTLDACGGFGVTEAKEEPMLPQSPPLPSPILRQEQGLDKIPTAIDLRQNNGNVNVADLKQLISRRPLRFEIFQPDPDRTDTNEIRKLPFTPGKKYPIYDEKIAGSDKRLGMNYVTIDDRGMKHVINDRYFTAYVQLVGSDDDRGPSVELPFDEYNAPMPNLRR